jgi:hypothetical protein
MISVCVAMTATVAATYIIPRADPTYQIAVQTAKNAGPP